MPTPAAISAIQPLQEVQTLNSPTMLNVTAVTVSGQWHFSKRNRRRGNGMRPPKNHARSRDGCRGLRDLPVTRRVPSDSVREKISAGFMSRHETCRAQPNRRSNLSTITVDKSV
jgi:hypothetical protein